MEEIMKALATAGIVVPEGTTYVGLMAIMEKNKGVLEALDATQVAIEAAQSETPPEDKQKTPPEDKPETPPEDKQKTPPEDKPETPPEDKPENPLKKSGDLPDKNLSPKTKETEDKPKTPLVNFR